MNKCLNQDFQDLWILRIRRNKSWSSFNPVNPDSDNELQADSSSNSKSGRSSEIRIVSKGEDPPMEDGSIEI